jgi:hypothetical protein
MKKIVSIFQKHPYFLVLFPVYFVFHGFTENYDLVPLPDAVKLAAIYIITSLLVFFLLFLFYKHVKRAALGAFLIATINFFFGPVHDLLKKTFHGSFIIKYSFLLPLIFILLLIFLILAKKKRWHLIKTTLYLNLLLVIILLIDAISLGIKTVNHKNYSSSIATEFIACDSCQKPDVYLIVADEYAGREELKDIFSFDNAAFENDLMQRGFTIVSGARSNYNFTPFSIASMLNMNYLNGIEGNNSSKQDMSVCYSTIKKNKLLAFLEHSGYDFYNYSIFDFDRQPSVTIPTFLPRKTILITSQTLLSRLQRDLWFHLVTDLHLRSAIKYSIYNDHYNNEKILKLTEQAVKNNSAPKFVYTHVVMPHYPYYFDRFEKPTPESQLNDSNNPNKQAYIEYLHYANKKLLNLIDKILSTSKKPPILILIGDHGFRQFTERTDHKYYFMNLDAVYFPDHDYSKFYDSMSLVNQFRVILNAQFNQHFALLKDSTSFLIDKK